MCARARPTPAPTRVVRPRDSYLRARHIYRGEGLGEGWRELMSVGLQGPQIWVQAPDAEGDGHDTAQTFSLLDTLGLVQDGLGYLLKRHGGKPF